MPEISRFYGIKILMNFMDHAPPHFHAWYGEYKITVSIKEGIVKGEMPKRALKLVFDWLAIHKEDLMDRWEKAQQGSTLDAIKPLK